ncbi:type II toxin-antitoxin system ParD family antitoxin [Tolypothrix sp. PCC 7910]|uniref:type II toxin-antitoxin system ParD family antitoxin n=1 Tax=Tolypothrix sp. PCC 7910 TaxID=2099387 RepID=UPI001FCC0C6B|nr:type II toxin-antitoxin system ParD family antitoxin [Tolypothrix sp. PCC 7910]
MMAGLHREAQQWRCRIINVHLGEALDKFVAELIASGLYQSQSEVIHEGLRLLKEREDLRKLKLEELRRDIHKGIDQLDRGEFSTYTSTQELAEEIKATGRNKLAVSRKND